VLIADIANQLYEAHLVRRRAAILAGDTNVRGRVAATTG
jgi:hypothetical protein